MSSNTRPDMMRKSTDGDRQDYTIGAEIEYQILDGITLNLIPQATALLLDVPAEFKTNVTWELFQSALEVRSDVCESVQSLEENLLQICWQVGELAEDKGFLLYAASLHPFARPEDQLPAKNRLVRKFMKELQIVGRQFIPQGLHVHVGLKDRKKAICVCNAIQAYLPLLLAASVSSPFFQGIDTGFRSYRTKLIEMLPAAGIYGYQRDWKGYQADADALVKMGLVKEVSDLQWDTRLNLDFATVEVRICDVPCQFSHIFSFVACIQSLVAALVEHGSDFGPLSHTLLMANKWQAARHGLQGWYKDPSGMLTSKQMKLSKALGYLLKELEPTSERLGCRKYLDGFQQILIEGTSADRQLSLFKQTGDHREVIRTLQRQFWS